ncbi:hypothetical protein ACFQ1M_11075 [Sungkyunkwania multivorans]|uniref:Uncharacterized protein n=1 Tax=Sungkyunkwania multivorans TaxID=1173618 RepID=A0ABW3D0B7_9FLAO
MSDTLVKNRFHKPIESLTIGKDDLLKFLKVLQERADSACEIECNHLASMVPPVDKLEQSIESLKSCALLKLTLTGSDGEELFGSIDEIFDSVSFPEQVKSVYVSSELLYEFKFNHPPRNRFRVLLDFTKPRVLDFSFLPSESTPNDSFFTVEGYDNTWVNGVFNEIDKFFDRRSSTFPRIHKNSFYDFIVWILGIPMSFWSCYKLSNEISNLFSNSFLRSAVFIYVFFLSMLTLRVLFHYFRWLYPKIQYKSKNDLSSMHRGIFYAITTGLIVTFLYDVLKIIF